MSTHASLVLVIDPLYCEGDVLRSFAEPGIAATGVAAS
jgi:hypothetical protein